MPGTDTSFAFSHFTFIGTPCRGTPIMTQVPPRVGTRRDVICSDINGERQVGLR